VDASTGMMPQSKEHILLARQVGVKSVVVWLNKCDLIDDPDLLQIVEMEIREELSRYDFDGQKTAVIHGSALATLEENDSQYGEKAIQKLLDAIDTTLPQPKREVDKPFLMAVEAIYNVSGRGSVCTGVVEQGTVRVGDDLEVVGMNAENKIHKATVTGIETFHKSLDDGRAGDSIGLLLRGPNRNDLKRGQVVCKPGSLTPHRKFEAQVYVLSEEEGGRHTPFETGYSPQVFFRTASLTSTVTLPKDVVGVPGKDVTMEFETIWPVAIHVGQKFSCREGGLTVAAGLITKVHAEPDKKQAGKGATGGKGAPAAAAGKAAPAGKGPTPPAAKPKK